MSKHGNVAEWVSRVIVGLFSGAVLGGAGGLLNGYLHAPSRDPAHPLHAEGYTIAVVYCVVLGAILGAMLCTAIAVVFKKYDSMQGLVWVLTGCALGYASGLVAGQFILASERAAFIGTLLTAVGGLAGVLFVWRVGKSRARQLK